MILLQLHLDFAPDTIVNHDTTARHCHPIPCGGNKKRPVAASEGLCFNVENEVDFVTKKQSRLQRRSRLLWIREQSKKNSNKLSK
jgi:hypothetical protein